MRRVKGTRRRVGNGSRDSCWKKPRKYSFTTGLAASNSFYRAFSHSGNASFRMSVTYNRCKHSCSGKEIYGI